MLRSPGEDHDRDEAEREREKEEGRPLARSAWFGLGLLPEH